MVFLLIIIIIIIKQTVKLRKLFRRLIMAYAKQNSNIFFLNMLTITK